jgi:putative SOS response-associated peptidase YedK
LRRALFNHLTQMTYRNFDNFNVAERTDTHNTGNNPHRMPAILRLEDHEAWLKGTTEEARAVLTPYPSDLMVAHRVSTRVNSVRNNGPKVSLKH